MPLSANSSAVLNVSMNSLTSGQNARLRTGIEKETEGVTLVSARHSPPAIPIAPLHFSAAIAVSSVAACVLFGFSKGLQSLVRLAALIQCGKHPIGTHRLLQCCRLRIMAVADIR